MNHFNFLSRKASAYKTILTSIYRRAPEPPKDLGRFVLGYWRRERPSQQQLEMYRIWAEGTEARYGWRVTLAAVVITADAERPSIKYADTVLRSFSVGRMPKTTRRRPSIEEEPRGKAHSPSPVQAPSPILPQGQGPSALPLPLPPTGQGAEERRARVEELLPPELRPKWIS